MAVAPCRDVLCRRRLAADEVSGRGVRHHARRSYFVRPPCLVVRSPRCRNRPSANALPGLDGRRTGVRPKSLSLPSCQALRAGQRPAFSWVGAFRSTARTAVAVLRLALVGRDGPVRAAPRVGTLDAVAAAAGRPVSRSGVGRADVWTTWRGGSGCGGPSASPNRCASACRWRSGYLRPLILLPGCVLTGLTAAQLEALLAHELAHIRRHDWLVNAFQLLVETVFFLSPGRVVALAADSAGAGELLRRPGRLARRRPRDGRPDALGPRGAARTNARPGTRRDGGQSAEPRSPRRDKRPPAGTGRPRVASRGRVCFWWPAWAGPPGPCRPAPPKRRILRQRLPQQGRRPAAGARPRVNALPSAKTPEVRRISGRVVDSAGRAGQRGPSLVGRARQFWERRPVHHRRDQPTRRAASRSKRRPPGSRDYGDRFPSDMLWVLAPGKELKVVRATKGCDGRQQGASGW